MGIMFMLEFWMLVVFFLILVLCYSSVCLKKLVLIFV